MGDETRGAEAATNAPGGLAAEPGGSGPGLTVLIGRSRIVSPTSQPGRARSRTANELRTHLP